MQIEILERLDEIEKLNPDPTIDAGALELMESFVRVPDDLRVLVERYGESCSLNIIRYLALLLARKAETRTTEDSSLILRFIEKLRWKDDPETLGSCLAAIYLQLVVDDVWAASEQRGRTLYPFLSQCLNHSGRQSVLVRHGALQVLSKLYDKGLVERVFEPAQLATLREKLMELSSLHNDLLDSQLTNLREFLKQNNEQRKRQ